MRIEVICTGDEVLTGKTINSNFSAISQKLEDAGLAVVWETTVGDEIDHNIHVGRGTDEDTFVAMREARDATLAMPKLIIPALQVNMRAGQLPPKDTDGKTYLKVPVNGL